MLVWLTWWMLTAQVPLWVTFDVANPRTVGGHRILHLEDVLGPNQRSSIPRLPRATAALIFAVRPEDCGDEGACAEVARWSRAARKAGGLVIAVILTERERADEVRSRMSTSAHPIAVAIDAEGVVSAIAGLEQPGTFVIVDGKGNTRRWTPAAGRVKVSARALEQIRAAFIRAATPRRG